MSGSGDIAGALQILHHVISTGVDDVEVLHNAGVIHSRRGEFAQALKALEQDMHFNPILLVWTQLLIRPTRGLAATTRAQTWAQSFGSFG